MEQGGQGGGPSLLLKFHQNSFKIGVFAQNSFLLPPSPTLDLAPHLYASSNSPENNPWFYSLILATSQPLQANPPGPSSGSGSGSPQKSSGSNKAFPIEALARREGVKLQEVYVPKNIVIPTKNQAPIGKSNFLYKILQEG